MTYAAWPMCWAASSTTLTSLTARVTLAAPDGRVATELELVVVAIDGQGGAPRAVTDAERSALSA